MDKQSVAQSAQSPEEHKTRECRSCYGAGSVPEDMEVAFQWFEVRSVTCPICEGSGEVSVWLYVHARRRR